MVRLFINYLNLHVHNMYSTIRLPYIHLYMYIVYIQNNAYNTSKYALNFVHHLWICCVHIQYAFHFQQDHLKVSQQL